MKTSVESESDRQRYRERESYRERERERERQSERERDKEGERVISRMTRLFLCIFQRRCRLGIGSQCVIAALASSSSLLFLLLLADQQVLFFRVLFGAMAGEGSKWWFVDGCPCHETCSRQAWDRVWKCASYVSEEPTALCPYVCELQNHILPPELMNLNCGGVTCVVVHETERCGWQILIVQHLICSRARSLAC